MELFNNAVEEERELGLFHRVHQLNAGLESANICQCPGE